MNETKSIKIQFSALVFLALITISGIAGELSISKSFLDKDLEWGPCPSFFSAGCEIAVLHGDPGQPNADIYFRVPGNYSFPAHWHTSPERMVLVSGEMDVNYAGQETANLKVGMYAYGPAKAVHDGRCISEEPCVLFIAFESPIDATEFFEAAD